MVKKSFVVILRLQTPAGIGWLRQLESSDLTPIRAVDNEVNQDEPPMINVTVGPAEQLFQIPRPLILSHCPAWPSNLENGEECHNCTLTWLDPHIFSIFATWLGDHKIDSLTTSYNTSSDSDVDIITLYAFANFLGVETLTTQILSILVSGTRQLAFPALTTAFNFPSIALPQTPLYDFLVEAEVGVCLERPRIEVAALPNEFIYDALRRARTLLDGARRQKRAARDSEDDDGSVCKDKVKRRRVSTGEGKVVSASVTRKAISTAGAAITGALGFKTRRKSVRGKAK